MIKFNTGRPYAKEGQIILAQQTKWENENGIMFYDSTRQIEGFIPDCALEENEIMVKYDSQMYEPIWGDEVLKLRMEV